MKPHKFPPLYAEIIRASDKKIKEVALCCGMTPKRLYNLMENPKYRMNLNEYKAVVDFCKEETE